MAADIGGGAKPNARRKTTVPGSGLPQGLTNEKPTLKATEPVAAQEAQHDVPKVQPNHFSGKSTAVATLRAWRKRPDLRNEIAAAGDLDERGRRRLSRRALLDIYVKPGESRDPAVRLRKGMASLALALDDFPGPPDGEPEVGDMAAAGHSPDEGVPLEQAREVLRVAGTFQVAWAVKELASATPYDLLWSKLITDYNSTVALSIVCRRLCDAGILRPKPDTKDTFEFVPGSLAGLQRETADFALQLEEMGWGPEDTVQNLSPNRYVAGR